MFFCFEPLHTYYVFNWSGQVNRYDGINEEVVKSVKFYATRLKRYMSHIDLEDIEQELMLEVIKSLRIFKKESGKLLPFIRTVLVRKSITIQRTFYDKQGFTVLKDIGDKQEQVSNFRWNEAQELISTLPHRYRLLFQLLQRNSISEIAGVFSVSRFCIYRDVKRLASFIHCHLDPNDHNYLRREIRMKNLSTIETSTAKELSGLPVHDLADLNEQVVKLMSHAKELKEKLDDALNLRFAETVQSNLRNENKDTGTTKFVDGGFQIVAEVPKKVTWNAEQMAQIIKNMPEDKRKSIVKVSYAIDERKYANLPSEYQQIFIPARTVTPGKMRFKIELPEDHHDVGSNNV